MSMLRSVLIAAAITFVAQGQVAPPPITSTNAWGMYSTFSMDPKDPSPERSVFQIEENDRPLAASEIRILTEALDNAQTVSARYFQRPSGRGTTILVIEIQARPRHLGRPAFAAYQIAAGNYSALSIDPPVALSDAAAGPRYFFVEPNHQDNGFKAKYPSGGMLMATVQVVNPFEGDWSELIPVEPDATHPAGHGAQVASFRERSQVGLVKASVSLLGIDDQNAPTSTVGYLNMKVHPHEWHELEVEVP